jgi:uncharacterized protein YkuJ
MYQFLFQNFDGTFKLHEIEDNDSYKFKNASLNAISIFF